MLFAGLGSVRMVKTETSGVKTLPSARGVAQHFQALGHRFSLYGPLSRQITYIFHEVLTRNQRKQNFWQGLQSPNAACASKSLAKRLFYGIKVSGYYNFDKELLQADQRQLNRFKKTHFKKSIKTAAEVIDVLHGNSLKELHRSFRFIMGQHI